MSTDLYRRVQEKIDWHALEIKKLKDWLVTYKELIDEIEPSGSEPPIRQHVQPASQDEFGRPPPTRSRRVTDKETLLKAAAEILESDQPLPTKVLFERLSERGIEISGMNPVHNLTNYLGREKERFKSKRGEGWSLVQTQRSAAEEQQSLGEPERAPVVDPADGL